MIPRTAVNGLLSVLLAPACAGCNAMLATPLDGCVCRNCWAAIAPVAALRFEDGAAITTLTAVGAYDGTLREIIHALKYQKRRSIAPHLARLMRLGAADVLSDAHCVIPVPLHWRRRYTRGFNQAREIARHLGLPLADVLQRRHATTAQVRLSAGERHANMRGAFRLRRPLLRATPNLAGLTVVLLDDVVTTGATLEACAQVLKGAGAVEVRGLTAARTV
jgi:ComF family protein